MVLTHKEIVDICNNEKTIAYYSGWGGIEIKSIVYGVDDCIVYVMGAWCPEKYDKFYGCSKIESDKDGKLFFRANRHVIPLDECMGC